MVLISAKNFGRKKPQVMVTNSYAPERVINVLGNTYFLPFPPLCEKVTGTVLLQQT